MANRKKKDEALAVVQAQTEGSGQPAVQSGYSAAGLDSRSEVENALANSSYKPSQTVTDAADALKEWQANRPGDYQSSYQERIDQLLNQLLQRESFQYSYTKDPLYRQYEQNYLQNAHNASADAAAQAAALTGGYGSSYATSAAQQAYQQQIGALSSAIPTLYSLALDTYTSGGNELVSQLDQLNNSEQDAQQQYNNKLSDYYTQLKQKGEAYNNAYAQDYGAYQDYLSQLGTLHDYYSAQEQQQAARRQQVFSNVMTVLGVLGDAVQIVLSGTTGVGSMLSGLLNTGYNIYSGNRQYEADRADTQWNQQLQERQYQDSLKQQLASQGIPFDQYLKMVQSTEEAVKAEAKEPAQQQVRMDLAIEALIKAEGIDATEEEIEAETKKVAEQYGMDLEMVKKYLPADQVKEQVVREKVIKLVADSATATAPVVETKNEEKKAEAEKTEEK